MPAGVAKWQTRQSQKLLGGDPRAGSTPASGTGVGKGGNAEWCNGNTGAFGASIPGSNPGSAARIIAESFLDSSTVEQAAVNRKVVGSNPTRGARREVLAGLTRPRGSVPCLILLEATSVVAHRLGHVARSDPQLIYEHLRRSTWADVVAW